MKSTRLLVLTCLLSAPTELALRADPITIFGTGTSSNGSVIGNGQVDPHYQLISSPDLDYPGPNVYAINSDTFMIRIDAVPNTAISRWIGPRADAGAVVPGGDCEQIRPDFDCFHADYHYQTTFDLTGLDHTSAVITGRWAMDESGEMLLNGANTGIHRSYIHGVNANFRTWASFTLSTGFIPGQNTLTLVVNNRFFPLNEHPNGTGVRLEILNATANPDACPNDPDKGNPGQCGCGIADTDADGDGTADCVDVCPNDPGKTSPGVCGCNTPDIDSDRDGTLNCQDSCPFDSSITSGPGPCGCGDCGGDCSLTRDSDSDGILDCTDGCPNDPHKTQPGVCGCGTSDTDSDGDGTPDCDDLCPSDSTKIAAGQCGCGASDYDDDGDGVSDCVDLCPRHPWKSVPGACGCEVQFETDADGDGVPDCVDQCPGTDDADTDGDGIANCKDGCPNDGTKTAPGKCGCGTPDVDSDHDGAADCEEECPNDPLKKSPGSCGCGVPDIDADRDEIADCKDNCPTVANPGQRDDDGDGIGNDCEPLSSKDPPSTDPTSTDPPSTQPSSSDPTSSNDGNKGTNSGQAAQTTYSRSCAPCGLGCLQAMLMIFSGLLLTKLLRTSRPHHIDDPADPM